jgi:hypothetical protein
MISFRPLPDSFAFPLCVLLTACGVTSGAGTALHDASTGDAPDRTPPRPTEVAAPTPDAPSASTEARADAGTASPDGRRSDSFHAPTDVSPIPTLEAAQARGARPDAGAPPRDVTTLDAPALVRDTPTASYTRLEIIGFVVMVSPQVLAQPALWQPAREELERQIADIRAVLPEALLEPLRLATKLWIELDWSGAAVFHPSASWLRDNRYNPDKAAGIEISNVTNFVRWSRRDQPWMVFHELAHAHAFANRARVNPPLEAAYKAAIAAKLYDRVDHKDGRPRQAYAATNAAEYFAELSEAYFGENDFFPFRRQQLAAHDPTGYQLMVTMWGEPTAPPPPRPAP